MLLHMKGQLFQNHLLNRFISPLNCSCQISNSHIFMCLCLDSILFHWSICLPSYWFQTVLIIPKSSNFIIFKMILAFLTIFLFQINFRINQLIYIYKKILQGFWLIIIKSIVHFGGTDISTMLNLPNHEHSISFHSFKSSLISFTSIL